MSKQYSQKALEALSAQAQVRRTRFVKSAKGAVQNDALVCTLNVLLVRTLAVCKTQVPTPEDPACTKTLLPGLIFQSDMACRLSSQLHVVGNCSKVQTGKQASKSGDIHVR